MGWGGGCLGALYKRKLLGKRKPCSGQGLVKSRLHLGCTSMHKPSLSSSDPPPTHLAPCHPVCSVLVKGGFQGSGSGRWAVTYLCEGQRNKKTAAAIAHLNLFRQPRLRLIQIASIPFALCPSSFYGLFLPAHR